MLFRLSLIVSVLALVGPCWGSMQDDDDPSIDIITSQSELNQEYFRETLAFIIKEKVRKSPFGVKFEDAPTFGEDFINYLVELKGAQKLQPNSQITKLVFKNVGLKELVSELWDWLPNLREVVIEDSYDKFPWFLASPQVSRNIPTNLTIRILNAISDTNVFECQLDEAWRSLYPACALNENRDNLYLQFLHKDKAYQINVYTNPQLKLPALGAIKTVDFVLERADWGSMKDEVKKSYGHFYAHGEKQYIYSDLNQKQAEAILGSFKASNQSHQPKSMSWKGKSAMALVGATVVSAVVIGAVAWYKKKPAAARSKQKIQQTTQPVTA